MVEARNARFLAATNSSQGFTIFTYDSEYLYAPWRPTSATLPQRQAPPNKALQRTRISAGCFPWRSVRAVELGRSGGKAAFKDFVL